MVETVEEIEKAISQLPQNQLMQFRSWYEKFDSDAWDKQIENDVDNGKLEDLANAAIADHLVGKSKKI